MHETAKCKCLVVRRTLTHIHTRPCTGEHELRSLNKHGQDLRTLPWSAVKWWRANDEQCQISFGCFDPSQSMELRAETKEEYRRWKAKILAAGMDTVEGHRARYRLNRRETTCVREVVVI